METETQKHKWHHWIPVVVLCAFVVMGLLDIPVVVRAVLLAIKKFDVLGIANQVGSLLQMICLMVLAVLCVDKLKSNRARWKKALETCFWLLGAVAAITFVSQIFTLAKGAKLVNVVFPTIISLVKTAVFFMIAKTIRKDMREATEWLTILIFAGIFAVFGQVLVGWIIDARGMVSVWDAVLLWSVWEVAIRYMEFANAESLQKGLAFAVKLGIAALVILAIVLAIESDSSELVYSTSPVGESASDYIRREDPELYYSMLYRYNSLF